MNFKCLLLSTLSLCLIHTSNAKNLTLLDQLFDENKYHFAALSPDGNHIGLVRQGKEQRELLIIDANTLKATNQIYFESTDEVRSFIWVNNQRIVITLFSKIRNREYKGSYGELYAIDIDKPEGKFIFGTRSVFKRRKLKGTISPNDIAVHFSHAEVLSTLPEDSKHILIRTLHYDEADTWVYKLNVFTGQYKTITHLENNIGQFDYTNEEHELWHKYWSFEDEELTLQRFDFEEEEWQTYKLLNQSSDIDLAFYSSTHSGITAYGYCGQETIGLCVFSPSTGKIKSIFHKPENDLDYAQFEDGKIIAARFLSSYPTWSFYDTKNSWSQKVAALQTHFKGAQISLSKPKGKNDRILVNLVNDVSPSNWYLYTPDKDKLVFIASSRAGSYVGQPVYSFNFKSVDKLDIQGYLTLPKASKAENLPAVLLVHGGPFGVRDQWIFNPKVQFFAALGYAVIQINYRGSIGKGYQFAAAGYRQWGGLIQQDLLQGVKYLVQQKIVDGRRICVMGSSFGAYSAVKISLMAPEQFKCAIATSGVYDLEEHYSDLDSSSLEAWFEMTMGDEKIRAEHSVIDKVKMLKTPLLISHGEKDLIADFEQFEDLVEELKDQKRQFEEMELPKEGHYFYNPKNRKLYYRQVKQFMEKFNPPD